MARTATIALGGTEYVVHPFNIDELQEVSDLLSSAGVNGAATLSILKIALRRATPTVADPGQIEIDSFAEVTSATQTILQLAGLTVENPQPVAPTAS